MHIRFVLPWKARSQWFPFNEFASLSPAGIAVCRKEQSNVGEGSELDETVQALWICLLTMSLMITPGKDNTLQEVDIVSIYNRKDNHIILETFFFFYSCSKLYGIRKYEHKLRLVFYLLSPLGCGCWYLGKRSLSNR